MRIARVFLASRMSFRFLMAALRRENWRRALGQQNPDQNKEYSHHRAVEYEGFFFIGNRFTKLNRLVKICLEPFCS